MMLGASTSAALAAGLLLTTALPSAEPAPRSASAGISEPRNDLSAAKRKRRRGRRAPATEQKAEEAAPAPAEVAPPPPLPKGKRAVALLPLEGLDVTPEMLRSIEIALLREIDELEGLEGVTPQDVRNDLSNFGLSAECDGDLGCLATAGRYARAHLSLETRVAALGGTISISLRLIDTQTGKEVGRVADPISEDDEARAEELHRMAIQLFLPETYVGALSIKSSVDGAEVYLDDKLIGTTPLPGPLENLRAGPHILRMTKPGFSDLYRFVDVVYNRSSTIEVDLNNTTIAGTIVEEVSRTGFGSLYVATDAPGVQIRIEGEPKGETPLEVPIDKVPAGKRRLSLRKEGVAPFTQEIEIVAGKRTDLRVSLQGNTLTTQVLGSVAPEQALPGSHIIAAAAADPQAPQHVTVLPEVQPWSPTWKMWTGVAVAGLGAVGLIMGGGFGSEVLRLQGEGNRLAQELEERVANQSITAEQGRRMLEELRAVNQQGPDMALAQFVSYGVGGALLAIGGGLMLWDLLSTPAPVEAKTEAGVGPSALRWGLSPTLGGAGGWLRLAF